jgi:hypothetical protein
MTEIIKLILKKFGPYIVIAVMLIAQCITGWQLYKLNQKIDNQAIALTNVKDQITLDTNGKLDSLNNTLSKQIAQVKNTSTHTNTVTYIEKEIDPVTGEKEDTDVELKTKPSKITVKVNDGSKYTFDQLPTENYKFENGKILMTQQTALDINVTQKKQSTSRLSVLALMRDKKHMMGGAFYNITPSIAIGAMGGQGMKPYYGMMFKVGAFK